MSLMLSPTPWTYSRTSGRIRDRNRNTIARVDPAALRNDGHVMAHAPALLHAVHLLLEGAPGAMQFAEVAFRNATGDKHVPQEF
jgi:hypothetical protein